MILRIVPGAITRRSVQALVLCDSFQAPAVELCHDARPPALAQLEKLEVSPELAAELGSLALYRAHVAGLQPNRAYRWRAQSGSRTCSVPTRTFARPEARELEVIVASCYYDGFNKDVQFLSALQSLGKHAAFKLLVGDNVYLDVHKRQQERGLFDGYAESAALYLQHYVESGYRDVLSHLPTYTTWDDHEFWNNYPEEQKWLTRSHGELRHGYQKAGIECLRLFQATLNPPAAPGVKHLSYAIEEAPLVSFFVADVRSQRKRRKPDRKTMLPAAALEALEEWAETLERPGVLVLGQPLCMEPGGKTDYNPPNFRKEFRRIWRAVAAAPFDILVVSGDVHHSRLLEVRLAHEHRVYEFVTSPACHIPTVGAIAGGTFGVQDRGHVHFPKKVERTGLTPAPEPRYHFGTDVKNTIGHLHFRRSGDDAVEVGCSFHDLDTARPARSTRANRSFLRRGTRSRHSPAKAAAAFKLHKRTPRA